jgi:hypothetical protein
MAAIKKANKVKNKGSGQISVSQEIKNLKVNWTVD